MGGNALQYVKTVRKTAAEYYPLMADVLQQVANLFPIARCTVIKNYSEKADFGDGDILLDTSLLPANWMRQVQAHFNPDEFVINRFKGTPLTYVRQGVFVENPDLAAQNIVPDVSPGCMSVSFDYQGFQIDIMSVDGSNFNSARDYYAYNDLGNLIGRIANRAGFKFGWQGLVKTVKEGSHSMGEFTITHDYSEMLEAFGYDAKRWRQGFKSREEVFEYAASSCYFHRDLFALENLNHENRARNKKRVTFMAFLDWLADKPHLDKFQWVIVRAHDESPERDEQLEMWVDRLTPRFQHLRSNIEAIRYQDRLTKAAKDRFDGRYISRLTGYHINQLGQFMNYCEQTHPKYGGMVDWVRWVDSIGHHQLDGYILDKRIEFDKLGLQGQEAYTRKRPSAPDPAAGHVNDLYELTTAQLRAQGRNHAE